MATGAELTYTTSASALQMANAIFGNGVTMLSASYSGPAASSAVYFEQQIALNANGTFTIVGDGETETVGFAYQLGLNGGGGPTDIGIVTITQIPCFVADTPQGAGAVKSPRPDDLTLPQDDSICPEPNPANSTGNSPSARRVLTGFEAPVWRAGMGLAA